jgi:hypothetical protein
MRPERRNRRTTAGAALVGWLFADLLLALAMIFLVANASGIVLARVPRPHRRRRLRRPRPSRRRAWKPIRTPSC